MSKASKITLAVVVLILLGLAGAGYVYYQNQQKIQQISNFDECVKAGYPILETYPEQCKTPDGRSFIKKTFEDYIKKKYIPPSTGCLNLCGDEICQEIVCQAVGCPCPETKQSCGQDCK